MHIECKLHRPGGSQVELDKITYHFAPQPDGAHVALVEREDHQDRLLAIPEGYRVYRGEHKPAAAPIIDTQTRRDLEDANGDGKPDDDADSSAVGLLGSDEHESSYIIHGKDYALGDIVRLAFAASGLSVEEWNGMEGSTRADLIDVELEKLNAAGPAVDERAELAAQYKAKTGNAAHHTWDAEKIRAKLAE